MSDRTPFSPEERERRGRLAYEVAWPKMPWRLSWKNLRKEDKAAYRRIADAVARDAVAGALREVLARVDRFRGTAAPGLDSATLHRNAAVADVIDMVRAMLAAMEAPPDAPGGEGSGG